MSEKMEPALSAQEWTDVRRLAGQSRDPRNVVTLVVPKAGRSRLAAEIAVANDLLPDDDPRKITRGTIAFLRSSLHDEEDCDLLQVHSDYMPGCTCRAGEHASALADVLESYLPPETL